jgi:hypothetical protein
MASPEHLTGDKDAIKRFLNQYDVRNKSIQPHVFTVTCLGHDHSTSMRMS